MDKVCFDETLGKNLLGYAVNIQCSKNFMEQISAIQQEFVKKFGEAIYVPKFGALHITVADYFSTVVKYAVNEDALFEKLGSHYSKAFAEAIKNINPFVLKFNELALFEPCAIVRGEVGDTLGRIRKEFTKNVQLLEGTKCPPNIAHSSILAFKKPVPFREAQELLDSFSIDIEEQVSEFRLIRETRNRMEEYSIVENFPLKGHGQ